MRRTLRHPQVPSPTPPTAYQAVPHCLGSYILSYVLTCLITTYLPPVQQSPTALPLRPLILVTRDRPHSVLSAADASDTSGTSADAPFVSYTRYQPPIIGSEVSRLPPDAAAPIRPCMEGRHVVHRRAKPPTRAAKPNSAGARVIADTQYFM
ncbi:hypothetical protein ACEPAI_3103 [Sanghuangporus weigelae]